MLLLSAFLKHSNWQHPIDASLINSVLFIDEPLKKNKLLFGLSLMKATGTESDEELHSLLPQVRGKLFLSEKHAKVTSFGTSYETLFTVPNSDAIDLMSFLNFEVIEMEVSCFSLFPMSDKAL